MELLKDRMSNKKHKKYYKILINNKNKKISKLQEVGLKTSLIETIFLKFLTKVKIIEYFNYNVC